METQACFFRSGRTRAGRLDLHLHLLGESQQFSDVALVKDTDVIEFFEILDDEMKRAIEQEEPPINVQSFPAGKIGVSQGASLSGALVRAVLGATNTGRVPFGGVLLSGLSSVAWPVTAAVIAYLLSRTRLCASNFPGLVPLGLSSPPVDSVAHVW